MASNSRLDSGFNKQSGSESQSSDEIPDNLKREEYSSVRPGKVCLECGQPLKSGRCQVTVENDNITSRCPVCGTTGQIIAFERLAEESEGFQNLIEQMELRRGEEL